MIFNRPRRKFISVDGHNLWCSEWNNNGEALVLLHGGLSHTKKFEKPILPAVARNFHVYAYDRTAHGRTKISNKFFNFDIQTKELIAYLETVVKAPAHLIGYSDGANVGLLATLKRPDLVKSLIGIGMNYTHKAGLNFKTFDFSVSEEEARKFYELSGQSAATLRKIKKKAFQVWRTEPKLKLSDLKKIEKPVLVVAADDEPFNSKMTFEMYEALPNGRLAVIPGSSHGVVHEKTKLLQSIIKDFYKNLTFPITKSPNRRLKKQQQIESMNLISK
jgi:pimeloyl-ACP methyl ester carboxylesterase